MIDQAYLRMMMLAYFVTVSIELPVLCAGLSARHRWPLRVFVGFWLTACTYPIVWLVLPMLFHDRLWYLIIAETFAPLGECLIFRWGVIQLLPAEQRQSRRDLVQDMLTIIVANLLSFVLGEMLNRWNIWQWV